MPIEPRLTRDGGPPIAPKFEQLNINRSLDYLSYEINVPFTSGTNDILSEDHELLWEPFFKIYFPEAHSQWVTKNAELDIDVQNENLAREAGVSFYKNSLEYYLNRFNTFLDEEVDNEGKTVYKDAYRGIFDLDEYGTPVSSAPENDLVKEQNKITLWKNFLEKKTDVANRARTVYLWIITDLMNVINKLQTVLVNKTVNVSLLNKAQRKVLEKMKALEFEKMEKWPFPIAVPKAAPVSHNGLVNFDLGVYKSDQTQLQEKSHEKNASMETAYGSYDKQNSFITTLIGQLEGILSGILGG